MVLDPWFQRALISWYSMIKIPSPEASLPPPPEKSAGLWWQRNLSGSDFLLQVNAEDHMVITDNLPYNILYVLYFELNRRLKALTLRPQRILLPTILSKRLHDDENIKLRATESMLHNIKCLAYRR